MLPGEVKMVTVGKFQLKTNEKNRTQRGSFVYGKSYLLRNNSVEFDPKELKLSENMETVLITVSFDFQR